MTVITGQRTTGNVATGQRKIDMSRTIALLDPNATPFTTILNETAKGGNRQKTISPEFKWGEDEREARWDAVDTTTGTGTTIKVKNADRFYPGVLVKIPRTGEVVRVTSIAGSDLTVVRAFGGGSAVAVADQDALLILGGSNEEGARSNPIRTENPAFMKNYTQIFRTSVGESGTWRSSENETNPNDPSHQRNKKGIEHQLDKEYAALFGVPHEGAGTTDGPLRTTGGLDYFLTENRQNASGTLTEATFEKFVAEKAFKHGSTEKTMIASPFVISVLNGFARGKLTTSVGQSKYGVNYSMYISPHGRLAIIPHKLLEGTVYGGMAYIVDFKDADVKYRYLDSAPGGSRDTKLLTNRQESDRDGQKDEYLTEAGFQIGQVKKHSVLYGVTG